MDPRTVMELYPVVQRWAHVNAAANFLQVQVDTEVGRLVEDHDAWVLVMNGTGECHDLARRIIAEQSPVEFSRMLNYTKGWDL